VGCGEFSSWRIFLSATDRVRDPNEETCFDEIVSPATNTSKRFKSKLKQDFKGNNQQKKTILTISQFRTTVPAIDSALLTLSV
jgi:hypothetical protein